MRIVHPGFGVCECVVIVLRSAVDSYIQQAYSYDWDRDLRENELNELQEYASDMVQEYAMENGSIDHN